MNKEMEKKGNNIAYRDTEPLKITARENASP